MDIIHIGGENTVTGSCHLLKIAGLNIMIDCGMAQGYDSVPDIDKWPVSPKEIDYLFITHAHIDHIGRIPELIQKGFVREIICTHPTKILLGPMLEDGMKFSNISEKERVKCLKKIDEFSWGFEYGKYFDLKKGIRFKLGCAGHILGSSFVRFEDTGSGESVIFSGDLGATNTPILPDPDPPEPCDLLVLESTYGNRVHEGRTSRIQRLGKMLTKALEDGGKVFIPAFALGRTQELLYEMDRLFSDPDLKKTFPDLTPDKKIPVFVDTPLGLRITAVYSNLSVFWDNEAKNLYRSGDHPIDFDHLYAVSSHRAHEKLVETSGPAIILAGAGMCTGGRIINHLAAGIENPENDVFFVGYQAKGTLGREILKYGRQPGGHIWIGNQKLQINAEIYQLSGYSAHADADELTGWVASMPEKPGKIKLVHGEPAAKQALASRLQGMGYNART
ncbi:MBL fold metallo-hydrolase [Desulfobacterales bacterium HSG16]|nr:MBL fold metallo-hydrolase [Desulfobacterales bacterium HSG16]